MGVVVPGAGHAAPMGHGAHPSTLLRAVDVLYAPAGHANALGEELPGGQ